MWSKEKRNKKLHALLPHSPVVCQFNPSLACELFFCQCSTEISGACTRNSKQETVPGTRMQPDQNHWTESQQCPSESSEVWWTAEKNLQTHLSLLKLRSTSFPLQKSTTQLSHSELSFLYQPPQHSLSMLAPEVGKHYYSRLWACASWILQISAVTRNVIIGQANCEICIWHCLSGHGQQSSKMKFQVSFGFHSLLPEEWMEGLQSTFQELPNGQCLLLSTNQLHETSHLDVEGDRNGTRFCDESSAPETSAADENLHKAHGCCHNKEANKRGKKISQHKALQLANSKQPSAPNSLALKEMRTCWTSINWLGMFCAWIDLSSPVTERQKVLLVDDWADFLPFSSNLLARATEMEGYSSVHFTKVAQEAVRLTSDSIDLPKSMDQCRNLRFLYVLSHLQNQQQQHKSQTPPFIKCIHKNFRLLFCMYNIGAANIFCKHTIKWLPNVLPFRSVGTTTIPPVTNFDNVTEARTSVGSLFLLIPCESLVFW